MWEVAARWRETHRHSRYDRRTLTVWVSLFGGGHFSWGQPPPSCVYCWPTPRSAPGVHLYWTVLVIINLYYTWFIFIRPSIIRGYFLTGKIIEGRNKEKKNVMAGCGKFHGPTAADARSLMLPDESLLFISRTITLIKTKLKRLFDTSFI